MSGADLLVDGFPHGTVAGYRQGCKSSGLCPGGYGQTCTQANVRASADWQYGKALAKDREVEFLEREWSAANAAGDDARPAAEVSAKVERAKRLQQRQQGVPLSSPLVVQAEPVPAPEVAASGFSRERRANMSKGAFAAQQRQREHALATASAEHPLGLSLNGQPRKRLAAGTVLFQGRLMLREDAAAAIAAEVPRRGLTGGDLLQRAESAARPIPEVKVRQPEAPVAGLKAAAAEAERLSSLLTGTDWDAVAAALGRIADAVEAVRRLGEVEA